MQGVFLMLKDHLLNWCRNEFEKSNAGFCDCSCNNKEYCHHDCQECLNQVHWYPTHGDRSDYDCPNLLLNYVLHYTDCYSQQISEALKLVDISRYPYYNIFSIGCGAAPDLMAFEDAVDEDQDTRAVRVLQTTTNRDHTPDGKQCTCSQYALGEQGNHLSEHSIHVNIPLSFLLQRIQLIHISLTDMNGFFNIVEFYRLSAEFFDFRFDIIPVFLVGDCRLGKLGMIF